jgi:two-component system sensor histidine kinase KdpD
VSQEQRPDPDELLRGIQKIESKSHRGHLRVFFGMCPGVGKTYAMLKAAQEKFKSGTDVWVGFVETHGRSETQALLEGLKVVPRKQISYRGTVLEEMDIDQILKEHPSLVVVDELAHTNAPESRHPKRYQDVEELLNRGIDVLTTVNVQHIESRADLVQQITGVTVRETVPDSVLEMADQIELIDLSPQELLKRLKEGKVYLGERANQAADHFFKEEHLAALRELALRFTAEKVDDELKDHMTIKRIVGPWNTKERLLVAISHSPYSEQMIRATRRLAFNLGAPWIALHVDTGKILGRSDYEKLLENLTLAKELGSEVITTKDSDISRAIRRVSADRNVTQIIMGQPDRRLFRDLISGGTLLDQLLQAPDATSIHILGKGKNPPPSGAKPQRLSLHFPEFESGFIPYWYTLWFMVAVAFMSYGALSLVGYRTIGFIFLLAVIAVSMFVSIGPTFFAATFSALVWNFFFIPPRFTLAIGKTEDTIMCLIFFVVSTTSGYLTAKVRKQRTDLIGREARANALYELSRRLVEAQGMEALLRVASECIANLFDASIWILLPNASGTLESIHEGFSVRTLDEKELAIASWSFTNGKKAGWSTNTLPDSRSLSIPLHGKSSIIGILLFSPSSWKRLSLDQENILDTIAHHLAIALERELFESKVKKTKLLEESAKLHQALLNSVSHEFRTPLTNILGLTASLQDEKILGDLHRRQDALNQLTLATERLNQVVSNLLDMSRIESGVLQLKSEYFEINEFVQASLQNLNRSLKSHRLELTRGEEFLILGDYRLLEHAMANILLNSVNYSPSGSLISVGIQTFDTKVRISIADEGQGIPEEALDRIFDKFYRSPQAPAGGVGLGLSIVKSLVELHGGRVVVENRKDRKGTLVILEFPKTELPAKLKSDVLP